LVFVPLPVPEDARLNLTHEGGLAAMSGQEWFEAYAGHEAYHHQQIAGVIAQLPGISRA
jgi:hypothetical protein